MVKISTIPIVAFVEYQKSFYFCDLINFNHLTNKNNYVSVRNRFHCYSRFI